MQRECYSRRRRHSTATVRQLNLNAQFRIESTVKLERYENINWDNNQKLLKQTIPKSVKKFVGIIVSNPFPFHRNYT